MNRIVVAIYTHPELYPPVLNTIDELAESFQKVIVISRNLVPAKWKYPERTQILTSGKYISVRDSEQKSMGWKFGSYLLFTKELHKILRKERPEWIMCNDPISLMSFRMIRGLIGIPAKLWYHSHDVAEPDKMRTYSVGYFAVKSERTYFNRIDLFTLPAESRLRYFPMDRLKGNWIIVPNFPSKKRNTGNHPVDWHSGIDLKLIYQGRISNEHGLEEILEFMRSTPDIKLTIIGPGNADYIRSLKDKISTLLLADRVEIVKPVSYSELMEITQKHHIGLAVNKPLNILYSTAAQASNKIYEYAALGLPILYFKNEHYMEYLGKFNWAFPTDLSAQNLSSIIQEIRVKYQMLSNNAIADFLNELNFNTAFKPVITILLGNAIVNS
jgi:hypothetical protein